MSFSCMDHQFRLRGVAAARPELHLTSRDDNLQEALLADFAGIFTEPHGLPLTCSRTSRVQSIILTRGLSPWLSAPIYIRTRKDALEWQCAALLDLGLIHRRSSTFSSPVLLVKKAYGSWCLCRPQARNLDGALWRSQCLPRLLMPLVPLSTGQALPT